MTEGGNFETAPLLRRVVVNKDRPSPVVNNMKTGIIRLRVPQTRRYETDSREGQFTDDVTSEYNATAYPTN